MWYSLIRMTKHLVEKDQASQKYAHLESVDATRIGSPNKVAQPSWRAPDTENDEKNRL